MLKKLLRRYERELEVEMEHREVRQNRVQLLMHCEGMADGAGPVAVGDGVAGESKQLGIEAVVCEPKKAMLARTTLLEMAYACFDDYDAVYANVAERKRMEKQVDEGAKYENDGGV